MIILPKDVNHERLDYFGWLFSNEAHCSCNRPNCRYTLVSERLIESFIQMRHMYGSPIVVSSLFRCQAYNAFIGGADGSKHVIGHAIDLRPLSKEKYRLQEIEFFASKFFDYVESNIGKGYVHAHNLPK